MNRLYVGLGVAIIPLMLALGACGDDDSVDYSGCQVDAASDDFACTNEADAAKVCTAAGNDTVLAVSQLCGLGCAADTDAAGCADTCIMEGAEISEGCTDCYVAFLLCAQLSCATECMGGATEDCITCLAGAGCYTALYACTGVNVPS